MRGAEMTLADAIRDMNIVANSLVRQLESGYHIEKDVKMQAILNVMGEHIEADTVAKYEDLTSHRNVDGSYFRHRVACVQPTVTEYLQQNYTYWRQ